MGDTTSDDGGTRGLRQFWVGQDGELSERLSAGGNQQDAF